MSNTERHLEVRKEMVEDPSLIKDDKKDAQTCKNISVKSSLETITETSNSRSIDKIKEMSGEPKSSIFNQNAE